MDGATVCTGIGSPEVAASWIDWRWGAEIDKHACAVLRARHPHIRNLGDMTRITPDDAEPVDIIVAGTPCQDFSVAGLRAGLAGERGNLTLEFVRLLGLLKPRWFVLENVPGLLSMDEGRAFGAILGAMAKLGYGFAYRVLDAQYAGVPQRRDRVFVVGYLGAWQPPAAVLFERESLRRDSPPSREAGQRVADPITASFAKHHGASGGKDSQPRNHIAFGGNNTAGPIDVATARNAHGGPHGRLDFESETFIVAPPITGNPYGDHESREGLLVAHSLRAEGFDAGEDGTGRGTPLVAFDARNSSVGDVALPLQSGGMGDGRGRCINAASLVAFTAKDHDADASDIAPTLRVMEFDKSHANGGGQIAVAFDTTQITSPLYRSTPAPDKPCHTLAEGAHPPAIFGSAVRRLTPRECERLQGFPDDYTLVPYGKKPMADGPRYRMLGNAMAVPVIGWILARVGQVDAYLGEQIHEAAE